MSAQCQRILVTVSKAREGEIKALFERDPLGNWEPLFADGFSKARFILQHSPCDALLVHEEMLERDPIQGLAWLCWRKDYPVVFLGQSANNFQRVLLRCDVRICSREYSSSRSSMGESPRGCKMRLFSTCYTAFDCTVEPA